jgi:hypothetical protein
MAEKPFVQLLSGPIGEINKIGASGSAFKPWELTTEQMKVLSHYYAETLDQGSNSYKLALYSALIGLAVFALAAALDFSYNGEHVSIFVFSAIIIEIISGVGLYLHSKTLPAMVDISNKMDRMQRYLLSYALCEKLPNDLQPIALADLMKIIASEK